jgi:hypothetical protein
VNCSHLSRGTYACAIFALLTASAACGGTGDGGFADGGEDGGTGSHEGGTAGDGSTAPPTEGGGGQDGTAVDSGTTDSSAHDSTPADTSPPDTSTTTADNSDGFGTVREACINTINALRAMQSLPPYTLLDTPAIDMCIDEQATNDESMDSPHYSIINNTYPACGFVPSGPFNAQDECEGYGNVVGAPGPGPHGTDGMGIVGCLYAMWAEQYDSDCLGCVGCTAFGGACSGCNYSGSGGEPECGHYVNMSASYFTTAACGFATGGGTWSAQNFY